MGKSEMVKVYTPGWAENQLPLGTDLVKIRDAWFLILWNDETCMSSPEPERWAFTRGELGESAELELYFPPLRHVADLVSALAAEQREAQTLPTR